MFSGIIKDMGRVVNIEQRGSNISFTIESKLLPQLNVDQSIAHNGVCLTIENITENNYTVTAVEETLAKTNLKHFSEGAYMNLEPCLRLDSLLDGHLVQGHVDCVGACISIEPREGSTIFTFEFPAEFIPLIVEKGSIAVNGVSLTAFNCEGNRFSVTIIPYTFKHTTFSILQADDAVNLEFDIIGKYFQRHMQYYSAQNTLYKPCAENTSDSIH